MENKKRLIDANALMEEVDKSKRDSPHPPGIVRVNHRNEHDHFLRMILDAPTVDAMEVVRCLKCRYRSQHSDDNGMYKCGRLQAGNGDAVAMVKPDFFCAYGERKDNGLL